MSRNLLSRIIVAAIAIPIILWISYHGGAWLFGMVALFALIATLEFLWQEGRRPNHVTFWLFLLAVAACFYVATQATPFNDRQKTNFIDLGIYVYLLGVGGIIVSVFLIAGMVLTLGKDTPADLFQRHARLLWGIAYLGVLYPVVYELGNESQILAKIKPAVNGDALLLLFGLLWVGDTAAMGIGKWLGRHKLAPTVSPNKTVEGFIGGIIGALVIGVVLYFWKFHHLPLYHILVLSLGCSIFGQLGDLVESMWKRSLGLKDSSPIIPGHGGVLDRFDSLLFAAPFMYGYILLALK